MAKSVLYDEPTETGHYGRNGPMQGHGICVHSWGGEMHLEPIVSQSRVSSSARISIPISKIDELIQALAHVRDNP